MNKINFDFNEHKYKKEAVHCKTQEEATQWCQFMYEHGLKWGSGRSYLKYNEWVYHKENTCYHFNKGCYSGIQWAVASGYTVIEFSSLINSKRVKL